MEVNPLGASAVQSYQSVKTTEKSAKLEVLKETVSSGGDSYIPSGDPAKKATYDIPQSKDIQKLKAGTDADLSNLKKMVLDLLKRQGYTDDQIKNGQLKDVKADEQTATEAQALLAPGGAMSAETVSDNIVEFAKAISNGDKSKLDTLKSAIKEGFDKAKAAFGGQLPGISDDTYKLVQEKLDKWENESDDSSTSVNAG